MQIAMTGEIRSTDPSLEELSDFDEEEKKEIDAESNTPQAPPTEDSNEAKRSERKKKDFNILPEVTPEIVREHLAQKEAAANRIGDHHDEPHVICGIPYYLFMTLTALLAAVTAGTVLAIIYYDPDDDGLQPLDAPSLAPTILATMLNETFDETIVNQTLLDGS